ncbi:MAG TPA: NADPH:quinone reductase [Vicinamibacterales bacterium]
MRAIRVDGFGGPEVMKIDTAPDPVAGEGQVVVRVRAAGVNPVDTYVRTGTYVVRPQLPYTPGWDAAGEIESVGPGVTAVASGDRVYLATSPHSGTYAERIACSASRVYRLPARVTFAQGAALGVPYATAYRALFHRGNAKPGETVLIHGATGGVGIAAVELAHARGLTVIGTGGTGKGRAAVRDRGADLVVDHRAEKYTDEIMKATGGRGPDLILEMLANVNLERDLGMLARFGRIVVVGNRGRVEINPRDAMGRDATILGMTLLNVSDHDLTEIHAALVSGLATGVLNPIVGRELPLAEAAAAHEAIMQAGALGKIVLLPDR